MIRDWLIKHRWVNELGKTIFATIMGVFSYTSWEAGKLASVEIDILQADKLMLFGVITGMLGTLALFVFVDVVYSIIGIFQKKNLNKPHTK